MTDAARTALHLGLWASDRLRRRTFGGGLLVGGARYQPEVMRSALKSLTQSSSRRTFLNSLFEDPYRAVTDRGLKKLERAANVCPPRSMCVCEAVLVF